VEPRPLPGLDKVRAELKTSPTPVEDRPNETTAPAAAADEPDGVEMEEPTTWDDRRAVADQPEVGFFKRLSRALRGR